MANKNRLRIHCLLVALAASGIASIESSLASAGTAPENLQSQVLTGKPKSEGSGCPEGTEVSQSVNDSQVVLTIKYEEMAVPGDETECLIVRKHCSLALPFQLRQGFSASSRTALAVRHFGGTMERLLSICVNC